MKKILIAAGVIFFVANSLKAQSKISAENPLKFSIGGEASLPIGKFNRAGFNFGVGGSLQAEYKRFSDFSLIMKGGFITYSNKSSLNVKHYSIVPVMAGFKYYFIRNTYTQLEIGAAFITTYGGGTNFMYSPGIGCMVTKKIDALIKFSGTTGNLVYNSLGLRLAYNFGK